MKENFIVFFKNIFYLYGILVIIKEVECEKEVFEIYFAFLFIRTFFGDSLSFFQII